jgi:GNAT superfamily N-acetyltransferase
MTTTVRRATREDVSALAELYASDELSSRPAEASSPESALAAYVDAFDAMEREGRTIIFVAEQDARVVGTFHLTTLRHLTQLGALTAQVDAVVVAADVRGRGVGAEMMAFAVEEARRRGCNRLQLTSNKKRVRAHRFYERLGMVASHEGFKLSLR